MQEEEKEGKKRREGKKMSENVEVGPRDEFSDLLSWEVNLGEGRGGEREGHKEGSLLKKMRSRRKKMENCHNLEEY